MDSKVRMNPRKMDNMATKLVKYDHSHRDCSDLVPRYSRQMLLSQVSCPGQRRLCNSKVLVVGAGGIGSAVIQYLAGAGIGHIDIMDFDKVELSNLHRQIIHDSKNVGMNKAISASLRVSQINDNICCQCFQDKLTYSNATQFITEKYHLIIDCTDNQPTRYIINDVCVLLNKPHIHGAAIGMEGQITVFVPHQGPCYRCLHPKPSVIEGCRSCASSGVLGPIPGLIGSLQAVEAIKLLLMMPGLEEPFTSNAAEPTAALNPLTGIDSNPCCLPCQERKSHNKPISVAPSPTQPLIGRMLQYDGESGEFHTFELPLCDPHCLVCSLSSSVRSLSGDTNADMDVNVDHSIDTLVNANPADAPQPDGIRTSPKSNRTHTLAEIHRITATRYADMLRHGKSHILLDVRPFTQFNMVSLQPWLPTSGRVLNYPYEMMIKNQQHVLDNIDSLRSLYDDDTLCPVYVLCKRGNDSILATKFLLKNGVTCVFNIDGGLLAWSKNVDPNFPTY